MMTLVTVLEIPCVSDMMKSSHAQALQKPSCKLRARSMGTPWAAVDTR